MVPRLLIRKRGGNTTPTEPRGRRKRKNFKPRRRDLFLHTSALYNATKTDIIHGGRGKQQPRSTGPSTISSPFEHESSSPNVSPFFLSWALKNRAWRIDPRVFLLCAPSANGTQTPHIVVTKVQMAEEDIVQWHIPSTVSLFTSPVSRSCLHACVHTIDTGNPPTRTIHRFLPFLGTTKSFVPTATIIIDLFPWTEGEWRKNAKVEQRLFPQFVLQFWFLASVWLATLMNLAS